MLRGAWRNGRMGRTEMITAVVRLTHLPTGIQAECHSERSMWHARETARRILRARVTASRDGAWPIGDDEPVVHEYEPDEVVDLGTAGRLKEEAMQ